MLSMQGTLVQSLVRDIPYATGENHTCHNKDLAQPKKEEEKKKRIKGLKKTGQEVDTKAEEMKVESQKTVE